MKKILYIEDNLDTASAVKTMLTNAGLNIETSSSGKEGLKLAEKENIPLVVTNLSLDELKKKLIALGER